MHGPGVPTLADFVRAHRRATGPDHPRGMSRQQLATAIHSSVGYIAKIEQGGASNPSPSVLDALAEVFALDGDERAHLYHLAQQRFRRPAVARPRHLEPELRTTVDAMSPHLAAVLNGGWDVIGANAAFDAALPGLLAKGNLLRWLFTDPRARLVIEEWEREATVITGCFRGYAGRVGDRDDLRNLLSELGGQPDFQRLWRAGRVYLDRRDPTVRLRNRKTGQPFGIRVQQFSTPLPEPNRLLLVGLVDL
ncbi:helix-turn-helix transcriptional regulator [Nocardia sp. NPDC058379]|uniref:helix-turn-helix transcriptional regulator n=1 Tax=unclassified Nocardia TaxID=2637762 RepID=UPI00364A78D4